MAAMERLTVGSLVLPVLYPPSLLVGLGLGTLGTIAEQFRCLAQGPRQLDQALPHLPGLRCGWVFE